MGPSRPALWYPRATLIGRKAAPTSLLSCRVRRTLAISCEGRTTAPWFTMPLADDDASTRFQPPLVSFIALLAGAAYFWFSIVWIRATSM
jgi:hypothetical protein